MNIDKSCYKNKGNNRDKPIILLTTHAKSSILINHILIIKKTMK